MKNFSKILFKFSILLRTLTGRKSLIRQALFGRVEETAFYVSIDIIWEEFFEKKISLSFLDNEHNFLCCKNCILRVPRNILTKVLFEENVYFFHQFRFFSKIFQLFVRILRTGLSKLKSTCRQERFEEKYFFWQNFRFSYRFHKWAKGFWPSGKNFPAGLWKLLPACQWDHIEKNFLRKIQIILIILAHWANLLRQSVEYFPAGLSEGTN